METNTFHLTLQSEEAIEVETAFQNWKVGLNVQKTLDNYLGILRVEIQSFLSAFKG